LLVFGHHFGEDDSGLLRPKAGSNGDELPAIANASRSAIFLPVKSPIFRRKRWTKQSNQRILTEK
jgi:hypothetical protein